MIGVKCEKAEVKMNRANHYGCESTFSIVADAMNFQNTTDTKQTGYTSKQLSALGLKLSV